MTFSFKVRNIPFLSTYGAARAHHDSIKPIRGRSPEVRPLADRRRTWFNIRLEAGTGFFDDAGNEVKSYLMGDEDVIIKLYGTDIVRYRRNGEVHVNFGGWDTITTRAALTAILNLTLERYSNRTWFGEYDGANTIGWRVMDVRGGWNVLVRNENNIGFRLTNPRPTVVHRVNRAGSKAVMDRHKPFLTYAENMLKLLDDGSEYARTPDRKTGSKWYEVDWALDENKYADLFENVCSHVSFIKQVMPLIKEAIKIKYKEEVFERIELTDGAMHRDRYGAYFGRV
jgi:hypothetical protein